MNKKLIYNYRNIIAFCFIMLLSSVIFFPFMETWDGFIRIITDSSLLFSDYVDIGSVGGAFMNSALLGIAFIGILIFMDIKPNGSTITALFIIIGFGFFGKNILNVWPVFCGCMLYAVYKKQPLRNYILVAMYSTGLAPVVNQALIFSPTQGLFTLIFATAIGVLIGFLLPPVTTYCMRLHEGFSLANAGFAAGLIAATIVSIVRAFGVHIEAKTSWALQYDTEIGIFLYAVSIGLIIAGLLEKRSGYKPFKEMWKESGKLVTDFTILYGERNAYFNMGLMGLIYTTLILIMGGSLNGATVAGVFTVIGFSSFGKHPFNALPVTFGAFLCSITNVWAMTSPQMTLGLLFSTTLAPIAGVFGPIWGIVAGFLHSCITMNIAYISGGINLYNNGFAGGIVAIVLIPIITGLRKEMR